MDQSGDVVIPPSPDVIFSLCDCTSKSISRFSFDQTRTLAKVVKVYDGDTCTVVFPWKGEFVKMNIRMEGYDSAEIRSKDPQEKEQAIAARDKLESLICRGVGVPKAPRLWFNDLVCVKMGKFDKYGRILAKIYILPERPSKQDSGGRKRGGLIESPPGTQYPPPSSSSSSSSTRSKDQLMSSGDLMADRQISFSELVCVNDIMMDEGYGQPVDYGGSNSNNNKGRALSVGADPNGSHKGPRRDKQNGNGDGAGGGGDSMSRSGSLGVYSDERIPPRKAITDEQVFQPQHQSPRSDSPSVPPKTTAGGASTPSHNSRDHLPPKKTKSIEQWNRGEMVANASSPRATTDRGMGQRVGSKERNLNDPQLRGGGGGMMTFGSTKKQESMSDQALAYERELLEKERQLLEKEKELLKMKQESMGMLLNEKTTPSSLSHRRPLREDHNGGDDGKGSRKRQRPSYEEQRDGYSTEEGSATDHHRPPPTSNPRQEAWKNSNNFRRSREDISIPRKRNQTTSVTGE